MSLPVLGSGCAIKPQPEPPPEDKPTIDLNGVMLEFSDGEAPIDINGVPGSVSHPNAIVRAFNLDRTDDPAQALVLEDGSFHFTIFGEMGDEVRLQVITPDTRSDPVDFILDETPTLSVRALAHCLLLTPNLELVTSSSSSVVVRNQCSSAVQLEVPVLRRPVDGVEVATGSWPTSLASGQSLSVPITLTNPDPFEDIVLITVSSPQYDRRPITVRTP